MGGFSAAVEQNSVTGLVVMSAKRTTLTGVLLINTTGAAAYLQLFDAAVTGDVTLGTTVPRWVVKADANDISSDDQGHLPPGGLVFSTGITVASTTTPLNSTTASQHVRLATQ